MFKTKIAFLQQAVSEANFTGVNMVAHWAILLCLTLLLCKECNGFISAGKYHARLWTVRNPTVFCAKDEKTLANTGGTTVIYGENGEDLVWDNLRRDAKKEASKEPLLASFLHASILSHASFERSLAFHMANLLSSPAMISTQVQALFLEAFENSPEFRESLRLDLMAVMVRDPAVKSFTDVLLYFKGFQALQAHRVAHWLWKTGRITLALFLHSRANTVFHIDIHPGAQLGNGILIDHGTGVVIGETARVGDNVSMLHKVTLGGAGIKDVIRHPQIGDGVLLGAGATLLGPIHVGNGAHIGACSMVLEDVPAHSVAVGVPARIISRKIPVTSTYSPALTMETNMLFFDI